MFNFFDDVFHFFEPDDLKPETKAEIDADPVHHAVHEAFADWQQATDDFFQGLDKAADNWNDQAHDFASAWHKATQSFADQFAHWFGGSTDDSPV